MCHLRYDHFKQSILKTYCVELISYILPTNVNNILPSILINERRYFAEYCEDEFISATSDSGFIFLDK